MQLRSLRTRLVILFLASLAVAATLFAVLAVREVERFQRAQAERSLRQQACGIAALLAAQQKDLVADPADRRARADLRLEGLLRRVQQPPAAGQHAQTAAAVRGVADRLADPAGPQPADVRSEARGRRSRVPRRRRADLPRRATDDPRRRRRPRQTGRAPHDQHLHARRRFAPAVLLGVAFALAARAAHSAGASPARCAEMSEASERIAEGMYDMHAGVRQGPRRARPAGRQLRAHGRQPQGGGRARAQLPDAHLARAAHAAHGHPGPRPGDRGRHHRRPGRARARRSRSCSPRPPACSA